MNPHVVFDFDWTMIDTNSDVYVFEKLTPHLLPHMNELRNVQKMQWTCLIEEMLNLLLQERTIEDLESCLMSCPMPEEMVLILNRLKESVARVSIVSDANTFFIETVLKHYKVYECVHQVFTNAAFVRKQQNCVQLVQFSQSEGNKPHNCSSCPINLCKGQVVKQLLSGNAYGFTVYVGDGSNDYCAAKQLSHNDYLFVRRGFSLEKQIAKNNGELKCIVDYWTKYSDLLQLFSKYHII